MGTLVITGVQRSLAYTVKNPGAEWLSCEMIPNRNSGLKALQIHRVLLTLGLCHCLTWCCSGGALHRWAYGVSADMKTKGPGSQTATLCIGGYASMYLYIISTVKEILQSHAGPRGGKWHDRAHTKRASQVYKQHFKSYVQKICFKKKSLFRTKQKRAGGLPMFSHNLQK